MGGKPVIGINELKREREMTYPSLRDYRVARYIGDSSNSSHNIWGRNGAEIQIS